MSAQELPENKDLIIDALEALWNRAPERRAEIETELRRHEKLPLAGRMVCRHDLRAFLAAEANEATR